MLNVIFPMAGTSPHFPEQDYPFPLPLIEVAGKTIVERVIQNFSEIEQKIQFIFILNDVDCRRYHLDSTLEILTEGKCKIIKLIHETRGAACSVLMAISHFKRESSLLLLNPDQVFVDPIKNLLEHFSDSDAGVVTFESVHPRWSYVKIDKYGYAIEAAEKYPISRNAIAGFYYFRKAEDFVDAAMSMIQKGASVNDKYYIAPTLNELILKGKVVKTLAIRSDRFHTFYSPQKIKDYENSLNKKLVKR